MSRHQTILLVEREGYSRQAARSRLSSAVVQDYAWCNFATDRVDFCGDHGDRISTAQ